MIFLGLLIFLTCCSSGRSEKPSETNMCPLCLNTIDEVYTELINIILNIGVIGSCNELCSYLQEGEPVVADCKTLCTKVGLERFVRMVQWSDGDTVWLCENGTLCSDNFCQVKECGSIKPPTFSPKPPVHLGKTVKIDYSFEIFSEIATGQMVIIVAPPKGSTPLSIVFKKWIPNGMNKGKYTVDFELSLEADPSKGVLFTPGTYITELTMCEGVCGSSEPHTRIIATSKGSFKVRL